jgi:hypothetical protein
MKTLCIYSTLFLFKPTRNSQRIEFHERSPLELWEFRGIYHTNFWWNSGKFSKWPSGGISAKCRTESENYDLLRNDKNLFRGYPLLYPRIPVDWIHIFRLWAVLASLDAWTRRCTARTSAINPAMTLFCYSERGSLILWMCNVHCTYST